MLDKYYLTHFKIEFSFLYSLLLNSLPVFFLHFLEPFPVYQHLSCQSTCSWRGIFHNLLRLYSCSLHFSHALLRDLNYMGWKNKLWHEISNNVVYATSKGSDQPAPTHSLIWAFASRLNILWMLSYWPNSICSFHALKEATQARLSLFMSKCHFDGNHMSQLKY